MTSASCPIWNTQAELLEKAGDYEIFNSPRAGGKYWISGTARGQVLSFTDQSKKLLTTWLCEQRRTGAEVPKIQSDVLDLVRSRQPLSVPSRLTAALLFLGNSIRELGDYLTIGVANDDTYRCSAFTESRNLKEISELYLMLRNTGFVEGQFSLSGSANVRPTASGWLELENLARRKANSSQAFVAMWFHDSTNDTYFKGMRQRLAQLDTNQFASTRKNITTKLTMRLSLKFAARVSWLPTLPVNRKMSVEVYTMKLASPKAWTFRLFGPAETHLYRTCISTRGNIHILSGKNHLTCFYN